MLPKRLLALTLFVALAVMHASSLQAQWVDKFVGGFVYCLATNGSDLFAGTIEGDGQVWRSTDNGATWKGISAGLPSCTINALASSGANLFAGTNEGVFLSTNNGNSWTAVNSGLSITDVQTVAVSGMNLFAWTNLSIFLSTNNGTSWAPFNIDLTDTFVTAFAVSGTNLFAGTKDSGIFLSTNSGTSWTSVNTGLTNTQINGLEVSGTSLFAGTNGDHFLSTNNGTSWAGFTFSFVPHAFAVSGTTLFAGTNPDGVFLSTDNGKSWTEVNDGFINNDEDVNALAVSGTNLIAGTDGNGIWARSIPEMLSSLGVTSSHQRLSTEKLVCAYPNPFSQSTTISFTPEASGFADVSIVNLLGVEVAHLFSGAVGAGEHSFLWSKPTGLPDGMYECLVRMNGHAQTLPVVLAR